MCDGYPGVGPRSAPPLLPPPLHLLPSSLVVASKLTPDMAFHRGAAALAPAPNESRPGLPPPRLLLLLPLQLLIRMKVYIHTYTKWVGHAMPAPNSVQGISPGALVLP